MSYGKGNGVEFAAFGRESQCGWISAAADRVVYLATKRNGMVHSYIPVKVEGSVVTFCGVDGGGERREEKSEWRYLVLCVLPFQERQGKVRVDSLSLSPASLDETEIMHWASTQMRRRESGVEATVVRFCGGGEVSATSSCSRDDALGISEQRFPRPAFVPRLDRARAPESSEDVLTADMLRSVHHPLLGMTEAGAGDGGLCSRAIVDADSPYAAIGSCSVEESKGPVEGAGTPADGHASEMTRHHSFQCDGISASPVKVAREYNLTRTIHGGSFRSTGEEPTGYSADVITPHDDPSYAATGSDEIESARADGADGYATRQRWHKSSVRSGLACKPLEQRQIYPRELRDSRAQRLEQPGDASVEPSGYLADADVGEGRGRWLEDMGGVSSSSRLRHAAFVPPPSRVQTARASHALSKAKRALSSRSAPNPSSPPTFAFPHSIIVEEVRRRHPELTKEKAIVALPSVTDPPARDEAFHGS
ncbi:hypothetical protein R3P38DRAFT_2768270 [Favolaschia claudopus]|uniref:Uncharacterized protein n=1 Tax=Favolaschia claudopus TaxID=2862362 RepID=A0AAW0CY30_9AGAR